MTEESHPPSEVTAFQAPVVRTEIGQILQHAIDNKVTVETIERLVALKERMEDRDAAREFNAALAAFQAECPPIRKTSSASITTRSGGSYGYKYAELDEIARTTRPLLTKHGLSYSWNSDLNGNKLICICTLRHIAGHSQEARFSVTTDTSSAMSDQQKVAAALTYARRQSLVQALGLTTTDADDDGTDRSGGETITDEQAFELNKLIKETDTDRARFLKFIGAESVEKLHPKDFARAKSALLSKKKPAAPSTGGAS